MKTIEKQRYVVMVIDICTFISVIAVYRSVVAGYNFV